MVAFLAIRRHVDSSSISRRRNNASDTLVQRRRRSGAPLRRRVDVPLRAQAAGDDAPSTAVDRVDYRTRSRLPIGIDGRRRRDFSEPAPSLYGLGGNARDIRRRGAIHTREFHRRTSRTLLERCAASFQHPSLGSGGPARRLDRSDLWKPSRCPSGASAAFVTRARRRRSEARALLSPKPYLFALSSARGFHCDIESSGLERIRRRQPSPFSTSFSV